MQAAKIEQFRKRLVELSNRIAGDVAELTKETADAPSRRARGPEDGTEGSTEQFDRDIALTISEEALREEALAALQRIEKGTFGQCETCGGTIAEARLQALPFARKCIKCASQD
ncbi:TraR/DksA C4-type zinc finger protein [bacterium]|nr:TraR/DksA C4-type zinc finger protein [bacterium]